MDLEIFWYCLIAVLWSGYLLLEGFDFGVGMLLPFVPRNERERGAMFESIGPVWDGNEVWLVVAAGATFAAFPAWYATMFSGFYLAFLLLLFFLIVRVVSFEWREKSESPRWRSVWLWANTIGSAGIALVWGIGLANLIHGVPLDSNGDYDGGLVDLFSAYTVFAGIAFVLVLRLPRCELPDAPHDRRPLRACPHRGAAAGDSLPSPLAPLPDLDGRRCDRPQRQGRLPGRRAGRCSESRRSRWLLSSSTRGEAGWRSR